MRRIALVMAAVAASFAQPASAEKLFFGALTFTAAVNCSIDMNEPQYSTFHPRVAGNEDFSGITHLDPFGGAGYELPGANFSSSFQIVQGHGVGWSGYSFNNAAVVITSQVPATITAATKTLRLIGRIKAPRGDPGNNNGPCIVNFKAVYVDRSQ